MKGTAARYLLFAGALLALIASVVRAEGDGTAGAERPQDRSSRVGEEAFAEANRWYEAGEYGRAIDLYRSLLERGVKSPEVFYNLGNAYFKNGQLGKAIVNLRRAQILSPRDDDVRYNLTFLRSLTRDKQLMAERNPLASALLGASAALSLNETLWLVFWIYVLLVVLLLMLVFWDTGFVGRVIRALYLLHPLRFGGLRARTVHWIHVGVCGLLLVLASVSLASKVYARNHRVKAVVLGAEVEVVSGPGTDYTVEFLLHEGTEVLLREDRGDWAQVELPGGLSGWVPRPVLEAIRV